MSYVFGTGARILKKLIPDLMELVITSVQEIQIAHRIMRQILTCYSIAEFSQMCGKGKIVNSRLLIVDSIVARNWMTHERHVWSFKYCSTIRIYLVYYLEGNLCGWFFVHKLQKESIDLNASVKTKIEIMKLLHPFLCAWLLSTCISRYYTLDWRLFSP